MRPVLVTLPAVGFPAFALAVLPQNGLPPNTAALAPDAVFAPTTADDYIHIPHALVPCAQRKPVNDTQVLSTDEADAKCLLDPTCALYVRTSADSNSMYICDQQPFMAFPANLRRDKDTMVGIKVSALIESIPAAPKFDARPNTLHVCADSSVRSLSSFSEIEEICATPECTALSINFLAGIERPDGQEIVVCRSPTGTEIRRQGSISLVKKDTLMVQPQSHTLRAPCGQQGPICPDEYNPYFNAGEVADPRVLAAKQATLPPNVPQHQ